MAHIWLIIYNNGLWVSENGGTPKMDDFVGTESTTKTRMIWGFNPHSRSELRATFTGILVQVGEKGR